MRATFQLGQKIHTGEVLQRNHHTTWVKTRVPGQGFQFFHGKEVVIKRHNQKHNVQAMGGHDENNVQCLWKNL